MMVVTHHNAASSKAFLVYQHRNKRNADHAVFQNPNLIF